MSINHIKISICIVLSILMATTSFAIASPLPKNLIALESTVGSHLFSQSYKAKSSFSSSLRNKSNNFANSFASFVRLIYDNLSY